jgi:hypothetical protein
MLISEFMVEIEKDWSFLKCETKIETLNFPNKKKTEFPLPAPRVILLGHTPNTIQKSFPLKNFVKLKFYNSPPS